MTVGSCISAFGKPASPRRPPSTPAFGEPVTATTVTITQPTSGTCTSAVSAVPGSGGFGRGRSGNGHRDGGPGDGGFPAVEVGATRPAGGTSGPGRGFGAASGSVTGVNGSTVTVSETDPRTQKTSSVAVTLTSTTTFTQRTAAAAVRPGRGQVCHRRRYRPTHRGGRPPVHHHLHPGRQRMHHWVRGVPWCRGAGAAPGAQPVLDRAAPPATIADTAGGDRPGGATGAARARGRQAAGPPGPGSRRSGSAWPCVAGRGPGGLELTGGSAPSYRTALVGTGTVEATLDSVGTITPVNQAEPELRRLGDDQLRRCLGGQTVTSGRPWHR